MPSACHGRVSPRWFVSIYHFRAPTNGMMVTTGLGVAVVLSQAAGVDFWRSVRLWNLASQVADASQPAYHIDGLAPPVALKVPGCRSSAVSDFSKGY